jgi:hypothetical protein
MRKKHQTKNGIIISPTNEERYDDDGIDIRKNYYHHYNTYSKKIIIIFI